MKLRRALKKVFSRAFPFFERLIDFLVVKLYPSPVEKKDLLLVRLDAIGDFILWHNTAEAIRGLYPAKEYRIVLLGNYAWCELASGMPFWDEVWPFDRRSFGGNLLYRLRYLIKVRKAGFAIVIQPTYSREYSYGDTIVRVSGAPERIGSTGDLSNIPRHRKQISDQWYTDLIPASEGPLTEIERNSEFVQGLGASSWKARMPCLNVRPDIVTACRGLKDYYVLFPGAGWHGRKWPVACFSQLAANIYRHTGWPGIVCGDSSEREVCSALVRKTQAPLRNLAGKTSLLQLVNAIVESRFVVSNETSAIHIAAAVGRPSVCILGGGHYGRFIPYHVEENHNNAPLPVPIFHRMDCFGCNWNCHFEVIGPEAVPCITNISVERVWQTVKPLIDDLVRNSEALAAPPEHPQTKNSYDACPGRPASDV